MSPPRPKIKVALYNVTTTTQTGGVESFVWELAHHLTASYPDLQVDIIGGNPPAGFTLPFNNTDFKVITRGYVSRSLWRKIPLLGRRYDLTKLLERLSFAVSTLPLLWREKYDIIHIQKPYDLPLAQIIRLLRGTKILFGCHGKDFFPGDKLFIGTIAGTVSCSQFNAQTVQERYNLAPVVVYNGIDVEKFTPQEPSATPSATPSAILRAQYATPDEYLVMQVGRQIKWKGVQYLIEAIAQLRVDGIAVNALLAGTGDYQLTLKALAERLGVAANIHFAGNIDNHQLPSYYALADIVVGTSFANETFGIALCEAAACQRPIVASDFGGFREVVQEGVTGLLYQPQNAADLAEKLKNLLPDQPRRQAMGIAGREFVAANFTWQKVAERVYQQYQRIAAP